MAVCTMFVVSPGSTNKAGWLNELSAMNAFTNAKTSDPFCPYLLGRRCSACSRRFEGIPEWFKCQVVSTVYFQGPDSIDFPLRYLNLDFKTFKSRDSVFEWKKSCEALVFRPVCFFFEKHQIERPQTEAIPSSFSLLGCTQHGTHTA